MNIKQKYQNAEISTKITLTYTACFILLMVIINVVMYFGVFYALYRPANRSLKYSIQSVQTLMDTLAQNPSIFDPNSIREPLVAGVVLRVVDDFGNIVVDTDKNYPSNELFEENKLENPSILADDDMDVADIEGALVYRAKNDYTFEGEHVTLYFFRTITSERFLLEDLENMLLILDIVGIIFALAAGNIASRKILKPIKVMTEHAQKIAFGKMNGRIEISPTNDELTELAKTFNDMLDRIQGGINSQQEFVVNAAHAIINPATAIFGNIELLKKYGLSEKEIFNESIDAISDSVQNMGTVIQNLFILLRMDQNRQKFDKTDLNLSYLLESAVGMIQSVSPNHKIEIVQNDDATIFGDEGTILQMLHIFLDNAVKYSPNGGKILVDSKLEGDKIYLSIADNGVGIASENLDKIFKRFFRVETVADVAGSGLGLSMARGFADNHDIKIEVSSEIGKGSIFTLIIPRK